MADRQPVAVKHAGAVVMGEDEQLIVPSTNGAQISGGTAVVSHHVTVRSDRKGIVGVDEDDVHPSDHSHLSLRVDGEKSKPGEDWVQWLFRAFKDSDRATLTLFAVPESDGTHEGERQAAHNDRDMEHHAQRITVHDGNVVTHEICSGKARLIVTSSDLLFVNDNQKVTNLVAENQNLQDQVMKLHRRVDELGRQLQARK